MDHQDSRMCPSTQQEASSSSRQLNQRTSWLITMGLVLTLAQPVWAFAGPPEHAKAVFMRGGSDHDSYR